MNKYYPDLNVPLLRKVVEWAETQDMLDLTAPERRWNQAHWFIDYEVSQDEEYQAMDCGTAYCLAGYVAIELEGWKPVFMENEAVTHRAQHPETGEVKVISTIACEALGIQPQGYNPIFEPSNSAATIRALAEEMAGERL